MLEVSHGCCMKKNLASVIALLLFCGTGAQAYSAEPQARGAAAQAQAILTPSQLAASIDKAYSNELRNPGAVVHLNNLPSRQVYVEGEVTKPGAFPLQPGMTAVQALALAGGVTDNSDPESAILIRRDACGQSQGSKIDLAAATKNPGSAEDVALTARDVVVVPKSRIANADLWVKQHIRDILPVEPYISPTF